MEKFYTSKQFLNKDGYMSNANIFTSIAFYYSKGTGYTTELRISDCSHSIFLELSLDDKEESDCNCDNSYENSLHKLNVLISELSMLKVKFSQAKAEYNLRKKARDDYNRKQEDWDKQNTEKANEDNPENS